MHLIILISRLSRNMKLSVALFAIVALSTKAVNAQKGPPKVDTLAPDSLPIFGTIAGYNPTTQVRTFQLMVSPLGCVCDLI
jgi:hypothetical protein